MAAKVRHWKGAWWLSVYHEGKRRMRRFGPSKAERRAAEKAAERVNAAIILGSYSSKPATRPPRATRPP